MAQGSSDYGCIAVMEVPADQVANYDQLLCQADTIFKRYDWRMLVPGQNAALFNTIGPPPGVLRKLMHVWSIPDFDSLPQVMAYAADNPYYVQAQALTIDEAQNLYIKLRWADPIGLPETPIKFYMMEVLHMKDGTKEREDFANYMNGAVYQMNTSYGWKIMFAGNAATGIIDEYVNVWGMSDATTLDAAIMAYRSNATWMAAVTRVATSLWTPRSLPCFETPATPTTPTDPK